MPISSASPSNNTAASSSYELFASGNVSVGDMVTVGDLMGALLIGAAGYILVVLFFLFGHLRSIFKFFKKQEEGRSRGEDFTLVRHYVSVSAWFVGGLMGFTALSITLSTLYDVDMVGRLTFFWEARYDLIIGSLQNSGKTAEIGKTLLVFLDIFSRFAYWSIVFVFLGAATLAFVYVASLMSDFNKGGEGNDFMLVKSFLTGIIAAVGEVVLFVVYGNLIGKLLLGGAPTIHGVGVISTVQDAVVKSLQYFVNAGLSGSL